MTQQRQFSPQQVQAFRYWIQGYQNFYEPLVASHFCAKGYTVKRPAVITKSELDLLAQDLFDGRRKAGAQVSVPAVVQHLRSRKRLQADALVGNNEGFWLVECKSWGGFAQFDEKFVTDTFVRDARNAAFLLLDRGCGQQLIGKILVLSSPRNEALDEMLTGIFRTKVHTLSLYDILREPAVRPAVIAHLEYLDAAVAEVKRALLPDQEDVTQ